VEDDMRGMEGVRVHRGLTANSAPLRELYARADLFVFPTRADCLPIAVMEAMAAGLPVIATGVGALREEVEEGVNGLIVPPGDPGAIVKAVHSLASDPLRCHAMSLASRQLAEERFDAARNYGAILYLMKTISNTD
jgi:glycosyltransferase involved in cell wall biosynthesis